MILRKLIFMASLTISGYVGFAPDVTAKPAIATLAASKGILLRTTPVCLTCHTSPTGGLSTLRPGVQSAYRLDRVNLSRLKNLINGCPAGTGLGSSFLCQNVTATETLGVAASGAAATDVYEVTCGTGTSQLHATVRDAAPVLPSIVAVQINKGSKASVLNFDSVDGDAGSSAASILADGAGRYTVNVNKLISSVAGAEIYVAGFACRSATGGFVSTLVSVPPRQDQ